MDHYSPQASLEIEVTTAPHVHVFQLRILTSQQPQRARWLGVWRRARLHGHRGRLVASTLRKNAWAAAMPRSGRSRKSTASIKYFILVCSAPTANTLSARHATSSPAITLHEGPIDRPMHLDELKRTKGRCSGLGRYCRMSQVGEYRTRRAPGSDLLERPIEGAPHFCIRPV